jgi:hypothetical protein
MDGIAALATTANLEVNRINLLEKENETLRKCKLIFCFSIKENLTVTVERQVEEDEAFS